MTKDRERRLMRLLHGELPADEARRLERQLERDGELRSAHRRLARAWNDLELPPVEVPAEFSLNVLAAARELPGTPGAPLGGLELSWSRAPAWARAGAAAALATGLLMGATFGASFGGISGAGSGAAGEEAVLIADADVVPLSLAEVYWLALEENGGVLAEDDRLEGAR